MVIDKPETCVDCPCHFYDEHAVDVFTCGLTHKSMDCRDIETCKPGWCPLHNLPENDNNCYFPDEWQDGYAAGWNACLDEILDGENRG